MKYVYFGPLRKVSSKGLENSYLKQPMSKIKDRGLFWFLVFGFEGILGMEPRPFCVLSHEAPPSNQYILLRGMALSLSLGLHFHLKCKYLHS